MNFSPILYLLCMRKKTSYLEFLFLSLDNQRFLGAMDDKKILFLKHFAKFIRLLILDFNADFQTFISIYFLYIFLHAPLSLSISVSFFSLSLSLSLSLPSSSLFIPYSKIHLFFLSLPGKSTKLFNNFILYFLTKTDVISL